MAEKVRVCLFGSRAAGKTTFLAGLAAVQDPTRRDAVEVRAGGEAKYRMDEFAATLRDGRWPPPTNALVEYTLEIAAAGAWLDLSVLDYPGDLATDLVAADDDDKARIDRHLRAASVLLLLVDPKVDVLGESETAEEPKRRIERLVALIAAARGRTDVIGPGPTPGPVDVAVVVTKADLYLELSDRTGARDFLRRHLPEFTDNLERAAGGRVAVFPLSAVGRTRLTPEGKRVPDPPLAPRGYRELFAWAVAKRRHRRNQWWSAAAALVVAVFMAAGLVQNGISRSARFSGERYLADESVGVPDRLRKTAGRDDLLARRTELARSYASANRPREGATVSELKVLKGKLDELAKHAPASARPEAREAAAEVDKLLAAGEFASAKAMAVKKEPAARDALVKFLGDYPVANETAEAKRLLEQLQGEEVRAERAVIRTLPVTDALLLRTKVDRIERFLTRYRDRLAPAEITDLDRVVALGRRFAGNSEYQLLMTSSGTFRVGQYHMVSLHKVSAGAAPPAPREFRTIDRPDAWREATWDVRYVLSWVYGDELEVKLFARQRSFPYVTSTDVEMANRVEKDPFALLALVESADLTPTPAGAEQFDGTPRVSWAIADVTRDDAKKVRQYLSPGGAGW